MAAKEIDKARKVAERALKTMSFREENEKFNIWIAYLNMENMFGTPDTLKQVFARAVQYNEPLKVHQELARIYVDSDKPQLASQLYEEMIKKFGAEPMVWQNYMVFLFAQRKLEEVRVC